LAKDIQSIDDLTLDEQNANQGTERGRHMVEQSMRETGAGRSVLIDKNGKLIAGNVATEAWDDLDGEIVVVKTDGHKLVVVQRTDLDLADEQDNRARKLAYYDNRSSEVGLSWNATQVAADLEAGMDLDDMFQGEEIAAILEEAADALMPGEAPEPVIADPLDELIAKWKVARGQRWLVTGKASHMLVCDDCVKVQNTGLWAQDNASLIYDPEWADVPPFVTDGFDSVIAFTDAQRMGDVTNRFGAPTWVFTWDCGGSWWIPNRPLKRAKQALWYGQVSDFDCEGAFYGEPGKASSGVNSRGAYTYVPDPRGKHLADVYSASLVHLHKDGVHSHEKPLDWIRLMVGDCFPKECVVVDPFVGSGTTIAACEQLGRPSVGIEIGLGYFAYTLERMNNMGCDCRLDTRSI